MKTSNSALKKSFSRNSVYGITFHWLRYTYGKGFEAAIAKAVWVVYVSSAFAASADTCSMVTSAAIQSREIFDQMMEMSKGSPKAEKAIPLRVEVSFKKSFEAPFDEGPVFEWLTRTYGDKTVDFIVHAVWLVYSPAAISASQNSSGEALLQVERSRLVFDQMVMWAISRSSSGKTALIANQLDKTLLRSSVDEVRNIAPPQNQAKALHEFENSASIDSEPETVDSHIDTEEDFDDDYVPPDYNLNF